MSDYDFDSLFTKNKAIIFNFHGYPWLIYRLAYRRVNHKNLHIRGYKEQGNINTLLEQAIRNEIDRFSLAIYVINRVPRLQEWLEHTSRKHYVICNWNAVNMLTSMALISQMLLIIGPGLCKPDDSPGRHSSQG